MTLTSKRMAVCLALALSATACISDGSAGTAESGSTTSANSAYGKADAYKPRELELLWEVELDDILEHPETSRFEASGVAVMEDRVVVVFDNLRRFVSLDAAFDDQLWMGEGDAYGFEDDPDVEDIDDLAGFEGVAYNPGTGELSLAIEAMETRSGDTLPALAFWNKGVTGHAWIGQELENDNNGIEGLAWVELGGVEYLVGLCETGKCDDRTRGRLLVLELEGDQATVIEKVDLPRGLDFDDFSGLAIRGDRIAVVSQESSRVWVGRIGLDEDGDIDLDTEDVWRFPRDEDKDQIYCTVEGIDWLADDVLVAVSDIEKDGQPKRCEDKAESLHLFMLGE